MPASQLGGTDPRPRVLVAEDDPASRAVVMLMLQKLGYRADAVANGLEVLAALERGHYDVVLMDLQMPELDGLEATRRIRAERPGGRHPRIVAMTATAGPAERESCLEAGVDGFLAKPVEIPWLEAAIEGRPSEAAEVAPAGAAAAEAPAVDFEVIWFLAGTRGDRVAEAVSELVDPFLARSVDRLRTIRAALADGDRETIDQAAHGLCGSSGSLGARRLAGVCRRLEEAASGEAGGDLGPLVEELEVEFERVRVALERDLPGFVAARLRARPEPGR